VLAVGRCREALEIDHMHCKVGVLQDCGVTMGLFELHNLCMLLEWSVLGDLVVWKALVAFADVDAFAFAAAFVAAAAAAAVVVVVAAVVSATVTVVKMVVIVLVVVMVTMAVNLAVTVSVFVIVRMKSLFDYMMK